MEQYRSGAGPGDGENHDPRTGNRMVRWGRFQTFAGSTLMLSGVGVGSATGSASDGDLSRPGVWLGFSLAVAFGAIGTWLFHKGRHLRVRGEQKRVETISSFAELDGERYVLYLRPFDLDDQQAELPTEPPSRWWSSDFNLSRRTHEEVMVRWFDDYGKVVAVGKPTEPLPLAGAQRGYLADEGWQAEVSRLIVGAHAVVMAVGPKPGTVWEFTEALRTTEPERLVLLVCHRQGPYDRFRQLVAEEYQRRTRVDRGPWPPLPHLPDYPPLRHPSRRSWDYGLKGVISFDSAWRATFNRFDPTRPLIPISLVINGIQRRGMKPVRQRLAQLPTR